ncbi:MAG: hypothetical protein IPJ41_14675 [Phycisphaerales bacterium]|nr:hypothetical protein [Phycisphaerales bacterium]
MTSRREAGPANERRIAEAIERVRQYLDYETMETRYRDALDFHDISVAVLREVVRMAFEAGYDAGFQDAKLRSK